MTILIMEMTPFGGLKVNRRLYNPRVTKEIIDLDFIQEARME